jgi:hypothetical protein
VAPHPGRASSTRTHAACRQTPCRS